MSAKALRVEQVSRVFGKLSVLEDISLTVAPGEFVALVGPSGCGKTTLLNLLSGYDLPSSGHIERPPNVRMVYQQDGLLPWLTVRQNVELGEGGDKETRRGNREQGTEEKGEKEKRRRGDGWNSIGNRQSAIGNGFILHPSSFILAFPGRPGGVCGTVSVSASGGMRQRAELARALGGDTDLLLLDEPFSALDYLNRLRLRHELALILQQRPTQTVLVTHDIEEACQLADRVLVLSARPARIQCEIPIRIAPPAPAPASFSSGGQSARVGGNGVVKI